MKKIIFILLILILSVSSVLHSQELTLNTTYYFNRQLFNPSYLIGNESGSINFTHRRQWIGINDAPVINYFNIQYPVTKNFGIGLNLSNGKTILLNNFNSVVSAAYRVNIALEHYLSFGLSIGANFNNLDLSEIENAGQDPVLIGAMNNSIDPDGRFGINYSFKKLNIGLAFTQLFGSYKYAENNFENIKVSPLDNFIVSANYAFELSNSTFSITPYVIYELRNFEYPLDIVEGVAFFEYKNILMLGAGYNSLSEISGHFMLTYNNKFRFRYSYEAPQKSQQGISNGSHEFQLSYLFGHKSEQKMMTTSKYVNYESSSKYHVPKEDLKPATKTYMDMSNPAPALTLKTIKLYEGTNPDFFEMGRGYYIVLGEFDNSKKAEKLNYKLIEKNLEATIGYSSVTDQYIVYFYKTNDLNSLNEKYENNLTLLQEFNAYGVEVK